MTFRHWIHLLTFYKRDLCYKEVAQSEYLIFREKWICEKEKNFPTDAVGAIVTCNKNYFRNIYALLRILAVLPVFTATTDTLRRLKSYLRNTSESELALLSVHRHILGNDEKKKILDSSALEIKKTHFIWCNRNTPHV